jgi:serine protease Do
MDVPLSNTSLRKASMSCFRADLRRARRGPAARLLLTICASLLFCSKAVTVQAHDVPGPHSVSKVAENLLPAVVNISTTQLRRGPEGVPLPKVPEGSPFEDFFDDFFKNKGGSPLDQKVSSLGSGFVIDGKEGLIVTNNHVVDGADEIVAVFSDGRRLKVEKIIGRDRKTDLALLKVRSNTPLPSVEFGSSATMKVGDWVMAIGNPFGLGGSLTLGIISAKQRDINAGPYDEFLQTDASINKGNSGGPLFNMEGKVIGVNTAIYSPTGGSIGIGFATPSDIVVEIVDQLRSFGAARRGWLGVKIQTVTEDIAESLGIGKKSGALIASVTPNSPAAEAGLKSGDVILKFSGDDVSSTRSLQRLVSRAPIGKPSLVEVFRNGKAETVSIELALLDDDSSRPVNLSGSKSAAPPKANEKLLGLTLAPLGDKEREKLGFDEALSGLLVMGIDPNSPVAEKNISVGDVVTEIQQELVDNPGEAQAVIDRLKKSGAKTALFLVENASGDTRFVAIPLE